MDEVGEDAQREAAEGLVEASRYRPNTLTPAGRRMAQRASERHDIVVRFLRAIGVPAAQAAIDAEGIEHHVGAATLRAMERVAAHADDKPRR